MFLPAERMTQLLVAKWKMILQVDKFSQPLLVVNIIYLQRKTIGQ